jgi:microcompartment protein CcmK/EutM
MRIAKTVGTVTLSRLHPSFKGSRLKIVVPLDWNELKICDPASLASEAKGEGLVAWDDLGAGIGQLVALAEGPEASQPFRPEPKAVDAYVTALIDTIDLDPAIRK